jgi:deazaflavin-dependent oxidoreductase (nitroreductase family)
MGGQSVLLLQTTGRRSGRSRTTPVQYLADGDTFVVAASNYGAARAPAWYLNLRADPRARIDVGGRSVDMRAQEVTGQERAELWRRLTAANRYLERAARKAGRELPLIALVPSTPTSPRRAAERPAPRAAGPDGRRAGDDMRLSAAGLASFQSDPSRARR